MITVVSDTHGTDGHRLRGRTLEAVREADLVVHAGDFVEVPVLDAFEEIATELVAVYGNVDDETVRRRLPRTRTVEVNGLRLALVHRVAGGETGLAMFGRDREAHLVVSGHSHRPSFVDAGDVGLLNPGSHAQPRGYRPGHAELDVDGATVRGRLCEPDGSVFEEFSFEIEP